MVIGSGGVLCGDGAMAINSKHERYNLFPVGTIVVIRPYIEFPFYLGSQTQAHFNRFLAQECKIMYQYHKCCLVTCDGGAKAWGYDWMDPKEELHLKYGIPDELFEI